MKSSKLIAVLVVLFLIVGGVFFMKSRGEQSPALQLYTWSNYFPEDLLAEFTKETGIEVVVSYFSSNEELFAKMVAGASGYDVIIPSDYMISRLIAREMVLPLDPSQIPALSQVDKFYRDLPFDPGLKYSVPFGRGHTGLLINTKKVQVPATGVSWELAFRSPDPKHTSYLDDMREVFAMGLMWKGFSPNSKDEAQLKEVSTALQLAKKNIAMFSSEPVALLLKGELNIAHAFSAHATQVIREKQDFQFFFPKEGAITWTDNYAIPKGSTRPEAAHKFIQFFLDPARVATCTEMSGLAAASAAAREKLPEAVRKTQYLYPDAETEKRLHFLDDLKGESLMLMNRLWTEMKSS